MYLVTTLLTVRTLGGRFGRAPLLLHHRSAPEVLFTLGLAGLPRFLRIPPELLLVLPRFRRRNLWTTYPNLG